MTLTQGQSNYVASRGAARYIKAAISKQRNAAAPKKKRKSPRTQLGPTLPIHSFSFFYLFSAELLQKKKKNYRDGKDELKSVKSSSSSAVTLWYLSPFVFQRNIKRTQSSRLPGAESDGMRPDETTSRSPLDKPLDQLTEEDISQLTREDCRRYLKEKGSIRFSSLSPLSPLISSLPVTGKSKSVSPTRSRFHIGMRRPSWNKSQAIQQVLSLKSLLETRSDSGAGIRQAVVSFRPENSSHHIPPVSAAEEHVSYRRKELPKSSFSGNVPARLPCTDNNKAIPPTPTRVTGITNEPVGQMTIFYHGKVNVYDGVPATKAKAIMQLAGSPIYLPQDTPSGVNRAVRPFPCHLQAASDRPGSSSAAASSPTLLATKVAKNTVQYKEDGNMFHEVVSEGTASRKASLQRYLEKRKDRYGLKG